MEFTQLQDKVKIAIDQTLIDSKLRRLQSELTKDIQEQNQANFSVRNEWQRYFERFVKFNEQQDNKNATWQKTLNEHASDLMVFKETIKAKLDAQ